MKHIRIISPSGVIAPPFIDGATSRLRAWGYKVSEGAHARDAHGRFAGTDEERLADLNEALQDESVDMILCSRGGYGMQRIIDKVAEIKKPILGFSDITALHQLSGIHHQPSLHGIMCKHIATLPEDSEPMEYRWESHPLSRPGQAFAPIVGGNLSVLYGLQGTPYGLSKLSYQFPILLIEDIADVLAHLSGLIVGQFSDCEDDEQMGESIYETIKEAVADYDYPVLFNAPIGHVEHNVPLWLHGHASIDCGTESVLRLDGFHI